MSSTVQIDLVKPAGKTAGLPKWLAARGYTWSRIAVEITLFLAMALSASILGPAGS